MNIEIDAKEYRSLLDILHMADVVMSGHHREEDGRTVQHRAVIQKLYALAKDAGLDRMMQFNDTLHKYVPTPDFEESSLAHVLLDEFGDHIFWDHLINGLSERDAAQLAGAAARPEAMSEVDRRALEGAIRQRYVEEFAANGVANLRLIEPFGIAGGTPVKTSD